jgi:hypothetical protein
MFSIRVNGPFCGREVLVVGNDGSLADGRLQWLDETSSAWGEI